jgi:putative lipoic acid-binding regulatory protein
VDRSKSNVDQQSSSESTGMLSFPCVIDIKVFLSTDANNEMLVRELIVQHTGEIDLLNINVTESRTAKYQSLSCRVNARSKLLIDQVFNTLSTHPDILMVL